MTTEKRLYDLIFSVLVVFAIYLLEILFRGLDNNTLVRWAWLFDKKLSLMYFLLTFLSLLLAYIASTFIRFGIKTLLVLSLIILAPSFYLPEVIIDSSRYFIQAKYLSTHGVQYFLKNWGTEIPAWTDTPLIPFIYGLLFRFFGEHRFVVMSFNSLLLIFSLGITYKTGKLLFNEKAGTYSAALLCSIPYLFLLTPQLLVDTNTMFFFILSIYLLISSICKGGTFRSILAGLGIALALLSKYSVWAISFIYPLILVVFYLKRKKDFKFSAFYSLALGFSIIVILVLLKRDLFLDQLFLLLGFQRKGLQTWSEGYISIFFYHMYPLIIVFCILGLTVALKDKDIFILIPLCFFVFIFIFSAKRMRYLIPFFPLIALLAGYGLSSIYNEQKQRYLAMAAIFWSFIVLSFLYQPFLNKTSMKNLLFAARQLQKLPSSEVNVTALAQSGSLANTSVATTILDYYLDKKLIFIGAWQKTKKESLPEYHPLRFTWEISLPSYYKGRADLKNPMVVIHDRPKGPNNADCSPYMEFLSNTGFFRFKTHISLYRKTCLKLLPL